MKPATKTAIETATHGVSRALGELLKAIEKHGEDVTDADSEKLFCFLEHSLNIIEEKADHARAIAAVTRGTFSFDSDVPLPTTEKRKRGRPRKNPEEPKVRLDLLAPATKAPAQRPKREGRISAYSPDNNPDLPTAPILPSSGIESAPNEIDFVD